MLGFSRKNSLLALAVGSALALAVSSVSKADTTQFDSHGFESSAGYTSDNALYNQPSSSSTQFGALNTASKSSSAIGVVNHDGFGGSQQSVQVNFTGGGLIPDTTIPVAGTQLGASPLYDSGVQGTIVTISSEIKVPTISHDGNTDGPVIGLTAYGVPGGGNPFQYPRLGGVGIDATTGELIYDDASNGPNAGFNTFNGDPTISANHYGLFTLTLDFTTHEATESVTVDSATYTATTAFTTTASSIYGAFLGAESTVPATPTETAVPDPAGVTTGYFDNYTITSNAVPEPATFGVIGLGLMGLLAKRTRRAVIA